MTRSLKSLAKSPAESPTKSPADFSSGALLRMVAESFARQGLALDAPTVSGHRVDLAGKRALLVQALARHGPVPILRAGLDIRWAPFHALTDTLTRGCRPQGLIARWQRLEIYFHSRHRIRVEQMSEGTTRLRHEALRGSPPLPAEDLLIGAVLAGLLMMTGARDVRLGLGAGDEPPAISDGRVDPGFIPPSDTMIYRLAWNPAGPDSPSADREPDAALARMIETPMARKVALLLARDMLRPWSLAELADSLVLSKRSLQRRLKEEHSSLSRLVARLRAHCAGRALAESDGPVTLAGFLAGYSDAAHFTREFKKETGLTPTEYRGIMEGGRSTRRASPSRY